MSKRFAFALMIAMCLLALPAFAQGDGEHAAASSKVPLAYLPFWKFISSP